MNFVAQYLAEAAQVAARIDHAAVESLVDLLADTRDGGGRLFVLGVGGSAGNASHAVNDFRKIAGFEAYAPTDNVSELTARINDDGWDTAFANWLKASRLGAARLRARVLGGRGRPGAEGEHQPGAGARARQEGRGRASAPSSGATEVSPPPWPTRA